MHKKDALIALAPPFGVMAPPLNSDSAINAHIVTEPLFGKPAITEYTDVSTGLSCGLLKVIPLGGFTKFLVTVLLPLITLRTTGLARLLRNTSIIPRYSICFMMPPIFIRMVVC